MQAENEFFIPDGRQRVAQHLRTSDLPACLDDCKRVRGAIVALTEQTVCGVHNNVKMVWREERIIESV